MGSRQVHCSSKSANPIELERAYAPMRPMAGHTHFPRAPNRFELQHAYCSLIYTMQRPGPANGRRGWRAAWRGTRPKQGAGAGEDSAARRQQDAMKRRPHTWCRYVQDRHSFRFRLGRNTGYRTPVSMLLGAILPMASCVCCPAISQASSGLPLRTVHTSCLPVNIIPVNPTCCMPPLVRAHR